MKRSNEQNYFLPLAIMVAANVVTSPVLGSDNSSPAYNLTDFERQLIQMPADSWLEVPNSRLIDHCAPDHFGIRANMGCTGIVEAWGSAAYGSSTRMLYVWGGGHSDYWGNEVYGFDLRKGRWLRLTDPTPGAVVKASGQDPLPDGSPSSRHTYDGLEYASTLDRLFAQGGAISPGGGGSLVTWQFNPHELTWSYQSDMGAPGGYGLAMAHDQIGNQMIVRGTKGLFAYDLENEQWRRLASFGSRPLWPRFEVGGNKTADIDQRRRIFWSIGNNDLLVWDIAENKIVTNHWSTSGGGAYSNRKRTRNYPEQNFESGGGDVFDAQAPGFAYDSKADQFVAWIGGAPHILDLASKSWRKGSGLGAPSKPVRNGTFGRWRYVPDYNVFVLVNGASQNVLFYKNTRGGPPDV